MGSNNTGLIREKWSHRSFPFYTTSSKYETRNAIFSFFFGNHYDRTFPLKFIGTSPEREKIRFHASLLLIMHAFTALSFHRIVKTLEALEKILIKTRRRKRMIRACILRFICFFFSRTKKRTNGGETRKLRCICFFFHRAEVNALSVCRCCLDSRRC